MVDLNDVEKPKYGDPSLSITSQNQLPRTYGPESA